MGFQKVEILTAIIGSELRMMAMCITQLKSTQLNQHLRTDADVKQLCVRITVLQCQ